MDWRKTSLVTGLLLLVALIGAITWTDSNGFSDESQYSSTATRDIIQWFRNSAEFGAEFEYRTNGASVSGFTRYGPIGKLFTSMAVGRRPLREFSLATDTSVRMYSVIDPAPGYTNDLGIVGYCSTKRIRGSTPFYQLSKESSVLNRVEYAYAYSSQSYHTLRSIGYANLRFLCYVQPIPLSTFLVVQIRKYERNFGRFRWYEYRKVGVSAPTGYKNRGVMPVVLSTRYFSGFTPVRVYYNRRTRDSQFVTRGDSKRYYTRYRGIIGFCSITRRSSEWLPIYQYGRYLSSGYPRDNGYTVSSEMGRTFIARGFKYEGILCYAHKA